MRNAMAALTLTALCAVPAAGGVFKNLLQVYDGPARPRSEVAVLDLAGDAFRGAGAYVWAIDGVRIHQHAGVRAYELLPGRYELTTAYGKGSSYGTDFPRVILNAEAGGEYLLRDRLQDEAAAWAPEIVTGVPGTAAKLDRQPICWIRSIRGTLAGYDCKAKKLVLQESGTAEPRTFNPGGCLFGVALLDANGALVSAARGLDQAVGQPITVFYTACGPKVAYGVRLEE